MCIRDSFTVEDRLTGRRPAQSAQCFGIVAIAARGAVGGRGDACPAFQAVAGAHPALLHFIPLGIAQLVEELAAPIAFAARPRVATRGHAGRTRQTVAQSDAPIGIAQTGQHGLDEIVVAALQDRRRAANG